MNFCFINDNIRGRNFKRRAVILDNELNNNVPQPVPENEQPQENENALSSKIVKKEDAAVYREPKTAQNMCERCGEHKKYKNSNYCKICERTYYKKRIPVLAWLAAVITVLCSVVAVSLLFVNFAPVKRVIEGMQAENENRLGDAYYAYEDAVKVCDELNSEIGYPLVSAGKNIYLKLIDVTAELYGPYQAGGSAKSVFDEDEIAKSKSLAYYASEYDAYKRASELVAEYVQGCEYGTMEPAKALEGIKKLEAGNDDLLLWIIYFESYIDVVFCDAGTEAQLAYTDRIAKLFPDAEWFFNALYIDIYYNLGRYDECVKYCDREIERNRNNVNAYTHKVKIAMLEGKKSEAEALVDECAKYNPDNEDVQALDIVLKRRFGEVQAAITLCDKLAESTGSVEMLRQQALNYLVQEDYAKAFDTAYNAYTNAYNYYSYGYAEAMTSELLETVYLCAVMCRQQEATSAQFYSALDSVFKSFEGYEKQASEKTLAIISGETTAMKALTEGTGDII